MRMRWLALATTRWPALTTTIWPALTTTTRWLAGFGNDEMDSSDDDKVIP